MADGAVTGGSGREIAIVGMAGRFPGARDLRQLWENLRQGREAVTVLLEDELRAEGVPPELLADPRYVRAASLLDGVDLFDAPFFGYSAREAELLDPQQRLFLEHAWEALEDAGCCPGRYAGLIGVYAGVAWNTYLLSNLTTHPELFADGGFQVFIASDKDFLPTRASYKLNLRGPSMVVQTSCSTSLVAVHLACLSLLNYECDLALAGGITVKVPQRHGYLYQEGGLASPDGHCRAFDARAAGTLFGSGAGVVALKRLADALADGDAIRAVVRGSAINNDGSAKVSYTAPSVDGQAEVIAAAQAIAAVHPETIRYVEAHGTGTALGDPIEITALTKVFREGTAARGFCAIGSVKSNLGHLDAAAGVAGLIKTVLALEHREIPPTLHFERPNPAIDFAASPFRVNAELAPWPAGGAPRRAAVSSFGVGGTNAHLILEEAPARPAGAAPERPFHLLLLSARSEAALEAATDRLADHLADRPAMDAAELADVALTLHAGRTVFRRRRALVARDAADAADALRRRDPARLLAAADDEEPRERPVAFLFPGQGSQRAGMGRALYEREPVFRAALDRAAELLAPALGRDLREVLYPAAEGDEAREAAGRELAATALAQPALFAVEHALAQLWLSWGVRPAAMLGHSVGEYVAACLAGVMSLADALSLVAARGRLMQAMPPGAMLSVPLAAEALAARLPAEVEIAAVNEPERAVAAGPLAAIQELERRLAADGIAARRLHTSHAFHSQAMEPVVAPFAAEVRKVRLAAPSIPFLSNVTGAWITPAEATDPEYWARHLRAPVRFAAGLAELLADPRRILLEVGPGRALASFAGRHPARSGQPVIASLPEPAAPPEAAADDAQAALLAAYGRLWLAGLELAEDAGPLAREGRRRVPLPTYPFERQRYWIEPGARPATAAIAEDAPHAPLAKRPEVADWFYLPTWRLLAPRHDGVAAAAPARRWLLLTTPGGLGERWASRLAREGREVVTAVPGERFARLAEGAYVLPPDGADGYRLLFDELQAGGGAPEVVVHAWTLDPEAPEPGRGGALAAGAAGFEAAQERGFYSLVHLARELGRAAGEAPAALVVLSRELVRLHAAEPLAPERATLLGFCRALPQEHPRLACRVVDLGPPAAGQPLEDGLLARLTAEAAVALDGAAEAAEDLVAYRGLQAFAPSFAPFRPPEAGRAPLRRHGVYLLTGGLEGNGYAIAAFLARSYAARLALVEPSGRAADPDCGARLEALRAAGAEVAVVEAELADEAAVALAVVAAEARLGALHGVIHAAGTAGTAGERTFRLLSELGREECAWHFVPKVHGLLALDRALAGRDLDLCLALSSLATVLGGVAYGAYAAANHFVDAFVAERQRRRRPGEAAWAALDWDLWAFEHEPEPIAGVRGDLAGLAMAPREGEEALARALAALSPAVERLLVSTADLPARVAERRRRTAEQRRARPDEPAALHPRPLDTPYVAPESELERRIADVWQRTLGFASLGVHDNFFELGGDSFVAIQVVSRLNAELGVGLPVAKLYQGLTIRSLAALLAEDEPAAAARWAAQLAERRQSMGRRKELLERRRSGAALHQG